MIPVIERSPIGPNDAEFAAEVRAFLDQRAQPRTEAYGDFIWGLGPDHLQLFEEPDPDLERARLEELRAWRKDLWEAGLAWITGPPELGGRGLHASFQATYDRLARGYHVPSNSPLTVSLGMVAPTILAHGSPRARADYLPAMHRATLVGCQLFSEPGAGSDLASVATEARRDGTGWRVTGQKVWTSGAHYSDLGLVLSRTAPGPRHANLTMFLIDMAAPGVEVRPLRQMTGGASFNEVFLDDVRVSDDDRLGGVGEGWQVARTTLSNERNAIGASTFGGVGLLSLDRVVGMVRHFGCSRDPFARQGFADLVIHLRVAKYNRERAGALPKGSPDAPRLTGPVGKLTLCGNLARLVAYVSSILGPRLAANSGEWGTYAWADIVLGLPGYRIGGGTDEILKTVVAERVLGLPR